MIAAQKVELWFWRRIAPRGDGLYPDYEIREDADPSTQAYRLDELGDDHYIGNQIREDLQSERSE